MITSDRLQATQHSHDWYATVHVMSGAAGVAIGLMFATTLGWLS
jgi:hypothetical protein